MKIPIAVATLVLASFLVACGDGTADKEQSDSSSTSDSLKRRGAGGKVVPPKQQRSCDLYTEPTGCLADSRCTWLSNTTPCFPGGPCSSGSCFIKPPEVIESTGGASGTRNP